MKDKEHSMIAVSQSCKYCGITREKLDATKDKHCTVDKDRFDLEHSEAEL